MLDKLIMNINQLENRVLSRANTDKAEDTGWSLCDANSGAGSDSYPSGGNILPRWNCSPHWTCFVANRSS